MRFFFLKTTPGGADCVTQVESSSGNVRTQQVSVADGYCTCVTLQEMQKLLMDSFGGTRRGGCCCRIGASWVAGAARHGIVDHETEGKVTRLAQNSQVDPAV
jgi:hypothetical protein